MQLLEWVFMARMPTPAELSDPGGAFQLSKSEVEADDEPMIVVADDETMSRR